MPLIKYLGPVCLSLLFTACSRPRDLPRPSTVTNRPSEAHVVDVRPVLRTPSEVLRKRWLVPASGEAVAYGDLGQLFRAELVQSLLKGGLGLARDYVTAEAEQCILEWSAAVREAAFWAKGSETLVVVGYDASALKSPLDSCIQKLGGLPRVTVGNVERAYALDDGLLVALPDVVAFGSSSLVTAIAASTNRSEWPKDVGLLPDQQIAFVGKENGKFDIKGSLSVTPNLLDVRSDITFEAEQDAKEASETVAPERLKQGLAQMSSRAQVLVDMITDCWHVERDGRRVRFSFVAKGDMHVIAERIGMVSAMGVYGVRKYIKNAKNSQARVTLARIAKDIAVAQPKRLSSLPPVPSRFEHVQGKKYHSTSSDWEKWKSIGFSLDEPQYHQFRVDAAKDGKSAEVVAEGDLDGNGKRSRLSLKLELDPKNRAVVIEADIAERDAQE